VLGQHHWLLGTVSGGIDDSMTVLDMDCTAVCPLLLQYCMMRDLEDAQQGMGGPSVLDVPASPPTMYRLLMADLGGNLWDL
jgi:hypothetical protein